jgi:NodT family efflux transporter outer membrane factor (OMF) lipoprotein
MRRPFHSFWLSTTCLLAACSVGPDYKKPATVQPAEFKESKDWKQATPKDETLRGNWWEMFNDPELNTLEEQVNVNNETIKAAEAQWRQARALVAEARSQYFPQVGLSSSFTRSGTGEGARASSGISVANIRNSYDLGGTVSWEADIWGKVRRQVEASKATAQQNYANLASVQLLMHAELAQDYLDLRVADAQSRMLQQTSANYKRALEITMNLYKAGVDSQADLLQAQSQLESTQAQYMNVGVARASYEHAIATLVGKAPSEFAIAPTVMVPLVPPIPTGVPSQILERRPDIAAAERAVVAANAQIGVTKAAFYPTLTLGASGGYDSPVYSNWVSMANRIWSIGPSVSLGVFDAGLRAAQTEAAIATYDQTVANYRQTVLAAFQAVEDNMAGVRILEQEQVVQQKAVTDAHKATDVIMNQYKSGTVSYLNVLTAQNTELNDSLTALTIQTNLLNDAVTLIQNLGGGWNASEMDKPEVITPKTTPLSIFPPS